MSQRYVHHVCIQTSKYQESLDFYTNILGFSLRSETAGFHGRAYNTWIELDGFMIELQTPKNGEELIAWDRKNAGIVHLCFKVPSVIEEYKRIKAAGYNNFKLKNGEEVYAVNGEALFKVKAPEGTEIEFRDTEIK